jgi:hypothetical protein
MITRTLVAVLAATASLVVAGCGSDAETPASKSSSQGGRQGIDAASKKAMLQFAQCMRDHGVNMPDPTFDSNGGGQVVMRGDKNADPEKMQTAEKACQKYQDQVKPPSVSPDQEKKMKEAALKNAQCMRDHGIDFPDPQFGEGGRMTQKIGPGSGIDPNSQKFQDAMKACSKDAPGGMMFGGPPSDGNGK